MVIGSLVRFSKVNPVIAGGSARRLSIARPWLVVCGVTALAAVLRLQSLGQSFFGDELYTFEDSTRSLRATLHAVDVVEKSPPLYFVLAWLLQLVGDPFLWLRLPSFVAGVATIPVIYVLGQRTVGRQAGVLGALLFALSPMAIFYTTEARAYALVTLFIALSTLALLSAVETRSWTSFAAFVLLETAAIYTHYMAIFPVVVQGCWALYVHRALARQLLLAHLAVLVLYLPWVPWLLDDGGPRAQRHLLTFDSVMQTIGELAAGAPFVRLAELPGPPALVLLAAAVAAGAVAAAIRLLRGRSRPVPAPTVLVFLLALAAPLGTFVYSTVSQDLFVARNLLVSLPALALAVAALLFAIAPRAVRFSAVAMAVAALMVGGFGTLRDDTRRPPYDDAAAFINEHAQPGDVVVELQPFRGPGPARALQVHLRQSIPWFPHDQQDQALERVAPDGRVFFVATRVPVFESDVPRALERRRVAVEDHPWNGFFPLDLTVYGSKP